MDPDDAFPPPIRRSSREALQMRASTQPSWLNDDDSDDAAPPPISRQRSASLDDSTSSKTPPRPSHSTPPVPRKSPLRSLVDSPQSPTQQAKNFSHPFQARPPKLGPLQPSNPGPLQHPNPTPVQPPPNPRPLAQRILPYRNRPKAVSGRSNPRLPPSLRRWSSLETIDSVTTTQSAQDEDTPRPSIDSTSTRVLTLDEEYNSSDHYSASIAPSTTRSDDTDSVRSTFTPTPSTAPTSSTKSLPMHACKQSSGSSLVRKLTPARFNEPLIMPAHLEIEKTVSFDQTSYRSNSSSSIMTISSGRPSANGNSSSAGSSRSLNSQDWKSSEYDTSGLSEAELKKCKKKGINPSLYAEMKAARKGKWVSPIGGNTIL